MTNPVKLAGEICERREWNPDIIPDLAKELAELVAENDRLKKCITDRVSKETYCPTCKACGEDGCCPPDQCKHLSCFYGKNYAKSYAELTAENERLRGERDGMKERCAKVLDDNAESCRKNYYRAGEVASKSLAAAIRRLS